MGYCVARNCRSAGYQALTGLCRIHFAEFVETAAKKPVVLGDVSTAECYLCGRRVPFSYGLYVAHNDEVGVICPASGHEIAVLRAK